MNQTTEGTWEAVMASEDLREPLTLIVKQAVTEAIAEQTAPVWVSAKGLAAHAAWGLSTVQKLSATDSIPGKVTHEGKVRFHVPTFDAWLLENYSDA